MTCKDCIHHVVCNRPDPLDIGCEDFSDRSAWVKLPSEDYTFTIRGDLARGIIIANCRAAEEKEYESNEK